MIIIIVILYSILDFYNITFTILWVFLQIIFALLFSKIKISKQHLKHIAWSMINNAYRT